MSELRKYYVDKEVLKERCCELIDLAYTQEPTRLELQIIASVDEVARYALELDGYITRKGEFNNE